MSDMKCPICNKPMKEQIDGTCISYQETNCICNIAAPKLIWKEMAVLRDKKNIFTQSLRMEKEFAEEECKRLHTELDRTRKALDVAVDALKRIDETRSVANHKIGTQDKTLNSGIVFCWTTPDEIHNALEQITALEQKDK